MMISSSSYRLILTLLVLQLTTPIIWINAEKQNAVRLGSGPATQTTSQADRISLISLIANQDGDSTAAKEPAVEAEEESLITVEAEMEYLKDDDDQEAIFSSLVLTESPTMNGTEIEDDFDLNSTAIPSNTMVPTLRGTALSTEEGENVDEVPLIEPDLGLTDTPVECGTRTCEIGEYCCSSSCSICAPLGTFCVAAVCETCGPVTCSPGDVCCNESCGICTPPRDTCTDRECEEGSSTDVGKKGWKNGFRFLREGHH